RHLPSLRPGRVKYVAIIAILVLFLLARGLPSLSSVETRVRDSHMGEDRPQYLYHSTFRDDPDLEYERNVSQAMRDLEKKQLALDSEDTTNTLWQILLDPSVQRGEDSLLFEEKNPEWNYALVNNEWAEQFIALTLGSVPGLATIYHAYPHRVLRGDLLRYLILWYYGGYYTDVDVNPAKSIKSCPSLQDSVLTNDTDISLVVGVEIDEPFASPQKMRDWHWVRSYGFLQYTIYAPRRFSPLLRDVIVRVLSHTKRHRENSNAIFGAKYNELTTLEITGPGVFTDAILDILSDTLPTDHPMLSISKKADEGIGDLVTESGKPIDRVTWAPFHELKEPLCVKGSEVKEGKQMGGLCALPINAWGNGQRHSGSEGFGSSHACINHRFSGHWKSWKLSWKQYLFG
ncbi:uncharacterized protein N7477_002145, partial [Penicillium maclennaniae]|uniref:uncharacterized protein n=1 Tax=Penicillium maclennaniae TaxID=1343394 RepID=UPI00253FB318